MFPNCMGSLDSLETETATGPIVDEGKIGWLSDGRKASAERKLSNNVLLAAEERRPKTVSEWGVSRETESRVPEFARCTKCGRKLTAEKVSILECEPYGPECIKKVDAEGKSATLTLSDYLELHPTEIVVEHYERISVRVIEAPNPWEDCVENAQGITDHQREELRKATADNIGILGGGPGTGKTFTIASFVREARKKFSADSIAICAPTGKAAVRVTEAMCAADVDLRASTWHSRLKVSSESGGAWEFEHNEYNPLPHKLIIGDETSMNDTPLLNAIMRARSHGAMVLFVGDVHQLTPVGHGAPLRDLIKANIPYGELTEIKRNSGGIVEACHAIREGRPWKGGDNLHIIDEGQKTMDVISRILQRCKAEGLDPVWDCQVVVPVNDRSKVSRKKVNQHLASELNRNDRRKGSPFTVGDKIVNTKNDTYSSSDGSKSHYVANGELAEVIKVEDKRIHAKLDSPSREVAIPRGKQTDGGTGTNWELGYALSVHRSQGSEWPVVICVIDEYPGARMVCSREWMYTAISRAKHKCYLVGKKSTADKFCKKVALGKRKTFLAELIGLNSAERELAGL